MQTMGFRRAALGVMASLALAFAAGCESNLTQENFAKIKKGMTVAEVQTILGSSGEVDEAGTGMTVSGAGVAGSRRFTLGGRGGTWRLVGNERRNGFL